MTPDEFDKLGKKMFPTLAKWKRVPAMAESLGLSVRTIWNYLSEERPIPEPVAKLLRLLVKQPRR